MLEFGTQALSQLPPQESLLKARISAHLANAAWESEQYATARNHYGIALQLDPSILRRLAMSIPVSLSGDGSEFANLLATYLTRSPRFNEDRNGLVLEIGASPDLSICLKTRTGDSLSCYTMSTAEDQSSKWNAQQLTRMFHTETFGLGYDISKAQRSILLGSSVILSSQTNTNLQQNRDAVLAR